MSTRSRKSNTSSNSSGSSRAALLADTDDVGTDTSYTTGANRSNKSTSGNSVIRQRNFIIATADSGDGLLIEKDGLMRVDPVGASPVHEHQMYHSMNSPVSDTKVSSRSSKVDYKNDNADEDDDNYDSDEDDDDDEPEMNIEELLYSSSSYYAIARPVTITMILAAFCVVYINTADTIAQGQAAMASAYQVWNINSSNSSSQNLIMSLANALIMVSFICCMTFGIVILYKFKCMKCLIGYMIATSSMLLGVLGGNIMSTFLVIYNIPVDKVTFYWFMANFAVVGVLAVFWGQGIPKYITQAYLIATSVILAWHLSYFDEWTTWTLLFMLAVYDLCAVLTPCGPLKALVNLMSQDDAPEMPGLLFEADLPSEARRPGRTPKNGVSGSSSVTPSAGTTPFTAQRSFGRTSDTSVQQPSTPLSTQAVQVGTVPADSTPMKATSNIIAVEDPGKLMKLPLAIAKIYQLKVVSFPAASKNLFNEQPMTENSVSSKPLLASETAAGGVNDETNVTLPENPSIEQLRALVNVRMPSSGGRLEQVSKRGKRVYLERDRYGNPKRLLWVDRTGKVYAEIREGDDEIDEQHQRNTIRLGLGDFIFYSVLVSKAAQYSFTTFAVCMLVILAGLGGTLVLLSVYHHALPALPISIFLGVIFYLLTRLSIEPWIEHVLYKPYYV